MMRWLGLLGGCSVRVSTLAALGWSVVALCCQCLATSRCGHCGVTSTGLMLFDGRSGRYVLGGRSENKE